jgi:hypothetical protein
MRIMIAAAVAAMTLCLSSPDVFGQGVEMRLPTNGEFPADKVFDSNATPRRSVGSGGRSISREPRVLTKGPLAPSAQDRANHASFLSQPITGLIRLLPRRLNSSKSSSSNPAVKIRGEGAYYSFFYRSHEYAYGSDIQLADDMLSVGFAGANYGILTNLGDVPLTDVTLEDPRSSVLADYKALTKESKARAEYRSFQQGVTIDGALYKSRLPLVVNSTYLLRSIVYRASDVLVAFRVVRKDTDGSAIILWKRLKKYSISALTK